MKDKLNSHGLFGEEDDSASLSTLSVRSSGLAHSAADAEVETDQSLDMEGGAGGGGSAPSSSGRETSSSKKERNLFKEEDGGEKERVQPAETENVRSISFVFGYYFLL
jgi:hypothetical protein